MFEEQDEALSRFLRRFPPWFVNLGQPWKALCGGLILLAVLLIVWLKTRDLLQFIGLWK